MKQYLIIILFMGMFAAVFSSCSSSQTITVTGIPGTIISNPSNKQLAVIQQSGEAKIKLKRKEGYYHYLQAQAPGSYLQVPFALDYKNHKTTIGWIGAGLTGISSAAAIVEAASLDLDENSSMIIMGGTALAALIGAGMTLADVPGEQYNAFKYQKKQITNNDIIR